jgi:hypothetical protein
MNFYFFVYICINTYTYLHVYICVYIYRQCFAELKELVRATLHPDIHQMAGKKNFPLWLQKSASEVLTLNILF